MKYLLDTNILLIYIRKNATKDFIEKTFSPFDLPNVAMISIGSVGEIKAIAEMNNWGEKRMKQLDVFIEQLLIIDINTDDVIENYVKIQAFSQNKLIGQPLGMTARNMGKNDLWIAACAKAADATLLTLDPDFSHLKDRILKIEKVELI